MPHSFRPLTLSLLTLACIAHGADQDPYFPKPSYFRKYFARTVTKVELQPPLKFEDYVAEGKLELSLKAFLGLVMSNNPNVGIQRLSLTLNEDSITRAFGQFDPVATASFQATRSLSAGSSALAGGSTINLLSQPFNLGVTQTLQTGTRYSIAFSDFKTSTNNAFATVNPNYSSNLNLSFSQPLLQGRGAYVTRIPVMIARSRLRGAQYNLEDQVIQILVSAEQAYWAVIGARENVRVAEANLKLADAALKRAERELELGAASPLDIFQPQQTFANAELFLTQANYGLKQAEDALRTQMGADLDPRYRDLPVVLTEPVAPPSTPALDRDQLVDEALARRGDLRSTRQQLDVDDLSIRQSNDQLRPNLSLTGQYGASGLGGPVYQRADVFGGGSQIVGVIPGGVTDALAQLFGFGLPTYGFGLSLNLPLKNHAAVANLADATVSKRLDALRVRAAEQQIRLQVVTAVTNLENSKASIVLARKARDLAQKRVEAEEKKYELGTELIFFVLTAQGDLSTAESVLVNQMINYRLNQLALLRALGTLLEERNIALQ
ncbi:MAG TPA: TolC family protein [Bryobacteraceae bacterium]|nr:TolC family protein [Bryobacteraceae bacterium]